MTRPDDSEVTVGSVWFVWGEHQEVMEERTGPNGREVRILPVRLRHSVSHRVMKEYPWVEAWRIAKFGKPSAAYA